MNSNTRRISSSTFLARLLLLVCLLAVASLAKAAGYVQPTGSVVVQGPVPFWQNPYQQRFFPTKLEACIDVAGTYWIFDSVGAEHFNQYSFPDLTAACWVRNPSDGTLVNYFIRGYCNGGDPSWNGTSGYCNVTVPQCPANASAVGSSQCQCNAGYEPNGTAAACVVPPTEEQSCKTANPVQPGTGRKRFTETDYTGAGAHPLTLARHYSSRWTDGATATGLTTIAAWDGGWRHSYQANITLRADGSLRAFRPDGTMLGFTASATAPTTWTAAGSTDTVTAITNGQRTGYTYTAASDDSVETYDATGKLQSIKARNGWITTLTYSDATTPAAIAPRPGLLLSVKNQFGRELKFTYDAQGRLAELLPPGAIAGQPAGSAISPIRYVYNEASSLGAGVPAQSQLSSVVWQDGSIRRYHHEDARWPQAVTGITDEAGVRYGTYAYDAQGRVTRSELAGGTERLNFAYAIDTNGKPTTTVTDYSGAGGAATSRSYTFTDIGNVRYPSSLTAPCSLCGSTQQSSTYDANGNPTRQIAHDGTVTFIAYDAKGRETERATYPSSYQTATTRPALSAASKVISTQWHATFNLPTQVAEKPRNPYAAPQSHVGQQESAGSAAGAALIGAFVNLGAYWAVASIPGWIDMWTLVGAGVPSAQVFWRAYQSTPFLLLEHGIGLACQAFGGYWAAKLCPHSARKSAAIAGAMTAVFALLQDTLTPYDLPIPMWSRALSVLMPIPAFAFGALLWQRRGR
jgi:YD repeat-containing protein